MPYRSNTYNALFVSVEQVLQAPNYMLKNLFATKKSDKMLFFCMHKPYGSKLFFEKHPIITLTKNIQLIL